MRLTVTVKPPKEMLAWENLAGCVGRSRLRNGQESFRLEQGSGPACAWDDLRLAVVTLIHVCNAPVLAECWYIMQSG